MPKECHLMTLSLSLQYQVSFVQICNLKQMQEVSYFLINLDLNRIGNKNRFDTRSA